MKHILVALLLWVGLSVSATAEGSGRLALVIGNGKYQHATVLPNTETDANAIAQKFIELDFQVSAVIDANEAELRKAIAEFVDVSAGGKLLAIYYAGHGVMANGEDFLLPIDFDPSKKAAALSNALGLGDILRPLEATGATVLSFVDTNRTPAFEGEASGTAGFKPKAESGGIVLSYSTSPGGIALDGQGKHSPYTAALLQHLGAPGTDLEKTLSHVRAAVHTETEGRQSPWDMSTLSTPLVLNPD